MRLQLKQNLRGNLCDPLYSQVERGPFFSSSLTFITPGAVVEVHRHHCYQLAIAINAPFDSLVGENHLAKSWGFITNQNVLHSCNAPQSQILLHFIDAESSWGRAIQRMLGGRDFVEIQELAVPEVYLNALPSNHTELTDEQVCKHIDLYMSKMFLDEMILNNVHFDERIIKMMNFVDQNLGRKLLLEEVAEHVYLSPDRARHFFIEQTGMPFSQYLLWKRIRCIAYMVHTQDISPVEACLHYGFTDYPHFSRIFKRMFGVAPNIVFKVCRLII